MRKDFSKILLCSDFDGTLAHCGKIPDGNKKALEYFMSHGGMFTLSTGRSGENILTEKPFSLLPNVPMVGLGGSQIYDLDKNKALEKHFLVDAKKTCIEIAKVCPYETVQVVNDDGAMDFRTMDEAVFTDKVYKVVFFTKGGFGEVLPEKVIELSEKIGFELSSNGPNSFEINSKGINKGYAARRIKEMLGAEMLVCVGDWQGDISMIKAADVGYAVANAHPDVKAEADRITENTCDKCAIAEIIEKM